MTEIIPLYKCQWRPVIIESPYGNEDRIEVMRNEVYCRAAIRDCLQRGEAPFASHGLYPLPGILKDHVAEERQRGMRAGFAIAELFPTRIFYMDRGLSSGMWQGVIKARELNQCVSFRRISGWESVLFFDLKEAVRRFVMPAPLDEVPTWDQITEHYPTLKAA